MYKALKSSLLLCVLFLVGCASNCVEKYTEYLSLPTCTETITTDCKKQSVVESAKDIENAFYNATIAYKKAYDSDNVTSEVASQYVASKDAFCNYVNSIGE